jgi:hypothetical protein
VNRFTNGLHVSFFFIGDGLDWNMWPEGPETEQENSNKLPGDKMVGREVHTDFNV